MLQHKTTLSIRWRLSEDEVSYHAEQMERKFMFFIATIGMLKLSMTRNNVHMVDEKVLQLPADSILAFKL